MSTLLRNDIQKFHCDHKFWTMFGLKEDIIFIKHDFGAGVARTCALCISSPVVLFKNPTTHQNHSEVSASSKAKRLLLGHRASGPLWRGSLLICSLDYPQNRSSRPDWDSQHTVHQNLSICSWIAAEVQKRSTYFWQMALGAIFFPFYKSPIYACWLLKWTEQLEGWQTKISRHKNWTVAASCSDWVWVFLGQGQSGGLDIPSKRSGS